MSELDTDHSFGVDHPTVQGDSTEPTTRSAATSGFVTLERELFHAWLYAALYHGFEQAKNVEQLDTASERVIERTFEAFIERELPRHPSRGVPAPLPTPSDGGDDA